MSHPPPPDPTRPPAAREPQRTVVTGSGARVVDELAAAMGGLDTLMTSSGTAVAAVAPGWIATARTGPTDESVLAGTDRPGSPVTRPGDAREIAGVAALCSGAAGYVTGASWPVGGVMLAMGPLAGSHPESHDWRRP